VTNRGTKTVESRTSLHFVTDPKKNRWVSAVELHTDSNPRNCSAAGERHIPATSWPAVERSSHSSGTALATQPAVKTSTLAGTQQWAFLRSS
jgi:hypothetical protein